MELSEFKQREIRAVEANFDGLPIVVNVNAVHGRHHRIAAERIKAAKTKADADRKPKKKKPNTDDILIESYEGRGRVTEIRCELYANLIKGTEDEPLLISWELTDQGEPIPCTVEELRKRNPQLLEDLYNFCIQVDHPKLQETRTTATNRTISDSTVATTPPQDTPTGESLTM